MISSNDFRPGVTIEFNNKVWQVLEAMHIKPGKGSAFVQTKLRNIETDEVLRLNFRAGQRVSSAQIEKLEMTFLYRAGSEFFMIDSSGEESLEIDSKSFGLNVDLLKEGLDGISVWRHRGNIIRVELPITVDLQVQTTPPDERGDTTSGSSKKATLETGAVILVPFHVKAGDSIRVDTRNREYVARV